MYNYLFAYKFAEQIWQRASATNELCVNDDF